MVEDMEKDNESYFKLTLDRSKNEVKFEVNGLNPIEVMRLAFGICQDALNELQPVEKSNIVKPGLKDSVLINKTKH